MQAKHRWVLWPSYIDSRLKRNEGRRVTKKEAIESPTVQMMSDALRRLGIEHEVDENASYPSRWYRKEGRILVDNSMKKDEILKKVCGEIRKGAG